MAKSGGSPLEKIGAPAGEPDLKLDDYLPYRLSVAANEVSRLISRAYQARFGLTIPQWRLIAVLAQDGPLTQQALCARTAMDKVQVSRAAKGLHAAGYVDRSGAANLDARSHALELSRDGRRLFHAVEPLALELERELLAGWAGEEVADLKQRLMRLEAAAQRLADG